MPSFTTIVKTTGYQNLKPILKILIPNKKMTEDVLQLIDHIIMGANGNALQLSNHIIWKLKGSVQYSNSCRINKDLNGTWKCGYYVGCDYKSHAASSEQALIDWARKKGFHFYFVGYSSEMIKL